MISSDYLDTYLEGWATGDTHLILSTLAEEFVLDDPHAGRIAKLDVPSYMTKWSTLFNELHGDRQGRAKTRHFSETLTQSSGEMTIAWTWWHVPGIDLQGAGLIKAGPDGVLSERLAYYTRLPV